VKKELEPEVQHDLAQLRRLRTIVLAARRRGARGWKEEDLVDLPRLYRHACSLVARLEASGQNPRLVAEARHLIGLAHGILYAEREAHRQSPLARLVHAYRVTVPAAIRAEWRLAAFSFGLLYGLAALSWYAVSRDLDLASSLLNPEMVENEIAQLQAMAEGERFRGNFTFGWGESPSTAGFLMLHNIGVGVLFFATALVPPLYLFLLSTNALMLGSYTAVAGHWGQAGSISSILWCHGVLEIQAIVLAGTAGLILVRAWVRPGPWTRRHALQLESRRALELLAAIFPMLVLAGLIEAFVSPHAPLALRVATAVVTGALLLLWIAFSGREPRPAS